MSEENLKDYLDRKNFTAGDVLESAITLNEINRLRPSIQNSEENARTQILQEAVRCMELWSLNKLKAEGEQTALTTTQTVQQLAGALQSLIDRSANRHSKKHAITADAEFVMAQLQINASIFPPSPPPFS